MTAQKLLPLQTRVKHFDGGPDTHGTGTIVAYNGAKSSSYLETNFEKAVELASEAGLLGGLVNSFYSGERCPYVVHWDPSEKYPEGYKDVYEPESLTLA